MDSMEKTPTTDRAVNLDEAISIAIQLQRNDQWVAAGDMYRRILEVAPDHPDAVRSANFNVVSGAAPSIQLKIVRVPAVVN